MAILSPLFKTFSIKMLILLFVISLTSACTNQKVTLGYDEPPLDLKVPVNSVSVGRFTSSDSSDGRYFRESLGSMLANEGAIKILTSVAEANLSGNLQMSQVQPSYHSTPIQWTETVDGKKQVKTIYIHHYSKKFDVSVTYKLTKKSHILGGNSYQYAFNKEWTGNSKEQAMSKAFPDQKIVSQALNQLAGSIVRGISSHQAQAMFKLQMDSNFNWFSHEGLKIGIDYYQQGLYSQAESYWKQVIQQETEPKIQAAAYYNLGVNAFREKRFAEAFRFFRSADQADPGNKVYMSAISQTEWAEETETQVKQITQNRSLASRSVRPYKLIINPTPLNSRVRIMNIKQKYLPGISLVPGSYQVNVDHPGYVPQTKWVKIRSRNRTINITLEKLE